MTVTKQAEREAIILAQQEKPFKAEDILQEIKPILEEYFIGKIELAGGELNLLFLNGQKICLTVRSIT